MAHCKAVASRRVNPEGSWIEKKEKMKRRPGHEDRSSAVKHGRAMSRHGVPEGRRQLYPVPQRGKRKLILSSRYFQYRQNRSILVGIGRNSSWVMCGICSISTHAHLDAPSIFEVTHSHDDNHVAQHLNCGMGLTCRGFACKCFVVSFLGMEDGGF